MSWKKAVLQAALTLFAASSILVLAARLPAKQGKAEVPPPPVDESTCTSVTYPAPSGAASNIVFTFDKPYACGRFANGDWWVSEDDTGTVTIISITPNAADGKNGYEVNPMSTEEQAFDIMAEVPYNASLMPSLPLKLSGVSSVVKAASIPEETRPQLQFAAVLTVAETPVEASAEVFRPTYFGKTKVFYNTGAIRVADLPKFNASSLPSAATLTIGTVADRYRHVQLDHITGWIGRSIHPVDNMEDYGAQIATDNAVSLLRLLLDDFDYADPVDRQALIGYLQMGIDLQGMAAGGVLWPAGGGHGNGRKLPLVFAAWAFNCTDFSNAVAVSLFSEDEQVWRSGETGEALFGAPSTDIGYWLSTISGGVTGARDARDPYGFIDGGGYEIAEAYQYCCTSKPWKYTVLALYMLGLEAAWGADGVLIDYVERWVNSGAAALPDPCAPYDGNPDNYGITYGPDGAGGCILGSGRWPAADGTNIDEGFYDSSFGEELWDWYESSH